MGPEMVGRREGLGTSSALGYLARSYPGRSLAVSACLLLSGLLEGIGISTVLPLISLVVRGNLDSTGALGSAVERLMTLFGLKASVGPLLALILAAFLFKAAIIYAAMRLAITTASGIVMEVRRAFLRSLLGARWDFFQSQPAGRLGGAISHEAEQVADLYLCACRMLAGAIQVAIYLGLAFTISWRLSLCALAVAGLGFAVLIRYVERMRRASTRFYERMRLLINGLIDALGGLKPLKAMGLESRTEPYLEGEIAALGTYRARAEMNRVSLDVLREPFQLIMAGLGFYIAYRFLRIGFAEMALTLLIFIRVLDATTRLQSQHQNFARLEPVFHSVRSIMDEAAAWKEDLDGGPCPEFQARSGSSDVTFRRGTRVILENVSLEIGAGRTTLLQGPSGAGKTTIVDLVAGLIKPDSGRITIDGVAAGPGEPQGLEVHDRLCSPGIVPVPRHDPEERHPGRPGNESGSRRGRPARGRRLGIHPVASRRADDGRRRGRLEAFGRPEAEDRHRPRSPAETATPHPRRGDVGTRPPDGGKPDPEPGKHGGATRHSGRLPSVGFQRDGGRYVRRRRPEGRPGRYGPPDRADTPGLTIVLEISQLQEQRFDEGHDLPTLPPRLSRCLPIRSVLTRGRIRSMARDGSRAPMKSSTRPAVRSKSRQRSS